VYCLALTVSVGRSADDKEQTPRLLSKNLVKNLLASQCFFRQITVIQNYLPGSVKMCGILRYDGKRNFWPMSVIFTGVSRSVSR